MPGARRIQVDVRDQQIERVVADLRQAPSRDPAPTRTAGPALRAAPRGTCRSPRRHRPAGCEARLGRRSFRRRRPEDRSTNSAPTALVRRRDRAAVRPHHVAHDGQAEAAALARRLWSSPTDRTGDRRSSAGMPGPVSATSTRTPSGRAVAAIDSVPPPGIASSALVTRLNSAISSCVASALIGGRPSATETCSWMCGARQPRLRDFLHARDDVGERHDLEPGRLPRVVEHRPQHARDLLNLRRRRSAARERVRSSVRGIVANHLDVARHQVQRRAGLVGDVGGDLAQRRHPLGARQRFAQRRTARSGWPPAARCAATDRASPPRCGRAATG